ncbi:MAG: zf-HC2 domain-containing protein [Candidatus Omnitrophota bacterium]|jgi:anti-sigma factor RsiW
MNCEKIKELILTDYIDNEINDEEKMRLNIHFANCQGCKEFLETVKDTVVKAFANAKKVEPSELIWLRVKEAIIAKQQQKLGFVASLLEKLKFVFSIPNSILTMSTIMALVLIVVLMTTFKFSNKETLETSREDQAEYSTYSIEAPIGVFLNNDSGFETLVEKYFL